MPPPDIVNAYTTPARPVRQPVRTASAPAVRRLEATGMAAAALGMACLVLMLYYVVSANHIAAQRYAMTELQERSAALVEEHAALRAQKEASQDPAALTAFARGRAMVEAADVTHLFENSDVALGR